MGVLNVKMKCVIIIWKWRERGGTNFIFCWWIQEMIQVLHFDHFCPPIKIERVPKIWILRPLRILTVWLPILFLDILQLQTFNIWKLLWCGCLRLHYDQWCKFVNCIQNLSALMYIEINPNWQNLLSRNVLVRDWWWWNLIRSTPNLTDVCLFIILHSFSQNSSMENNLIGFRIPRSDQFIQTIS